MSILRVNDPGLPTPGPKRCAPDFGKDPKTNQGSEHRQGLLVMLSASTFEMACDIAANRHRVSERKLINMEPSRGESDRTWIDRSTENWYERHGS